LRCHRKPPLAPNALQALTEITVPFFKRFLSRDVSGEHGKKSTWNVELVNVVEPC
jgi:hypothetical protein